MKTITVVVPTYNEEKNIYDIYIRVSKVFQEQLVNYGMQILFIDNCSTDSTRSLIRELSQKDERVQAIFNTANMGFSKSTFYGLSQAEGDGAVLMYADMQDPPEIIPKFVKCWEEGTKIVTGIKAKSKESRLVYFFRESYYRMMTKISDIEHINQFDGFGLYDASFIKVLRELKDPLPYLRGIIAELGFKRKDVIYTQEIRKKGKTNFNFFRLYDLAMLGITSSSKLLMRFATLLGGGTAVIAFIVAIVTFFMKIFNWKHFDVGSAAIIVGMFFIGAVQLFFLGLLGEYMVNVNTRVMNHPIVVEEERINMREKENIYVKDVKCE